MSYMMCHKVLQFTPIRGKLYQPTGQIVTYMFSIGADFSNIETTQLVQFISIYII